MTFKEVLASVGRQLLGGAWNPLARGAWCRAQRRLLVPPGRSVVWVRGELLPWAEWGAQHGYFEVERMDGLPYLRRLGATT
ncbi:MAG: hypothetical protein IPO09_05315 [Anaeromyxobacter sp.]|nr:hypothetical protein [Anaeromyxobacter sp.]MBL0277433.1 hypothetical protein [Anaeromyxobacter sp.]